MARRRLEAPVIDDADVDAQNDAGHTITPPLAPKVGRRKRDVPMGRITLSLERETIVKLRIAAISENRDPCRIVEDLVKPYVRPYVVSRRNTRELSENESAA